MIKCPFCGQEHPDTTKFCPETGKDLESQIWVCNNPDCTYRSQLPMTAKYCPHCGTERSANTFNNNGNRPNTNTESPLFGIVLGKTTMQDLIDSGKFGNPDIEEGAVCVHLTNFVDAISRSEISPICVIGSSSFHKNIDIWNEILPFKLHDDISLNQIAVYCRKNRLNYKLNEEDTIAFILPNSNMLVVIHPPETIVLCNLTKCSNCGNLNYQIEEFTLDSAYLRCRSCKSVFALNECCTEDIYCPQCGSTNYIDDGSGYMCSIIAKIVKTFLGGTTMMMKMTKLTTASSIHSSLDSFQMQF